MVDLRNLFQRNRNTRVQIQECPSRDKGMVDLVPGNLSMKARALWCLRIMVLSLDTKHNSQTSLKVRQGDQPRDHLLDIFRVTFAEKTSSFPWVSLAYFLRGTAHNCKYPPIHVLLHPPLGEWGYHPGSRR